jgi:hypothetical protein
MAVKRATAFATIARCYDVLMFLGKNRLNNGQNDTGIIDNQDFHAGTPSIVKPSYHPPAPFKAKAIPMYISICNYFLI